jgi:hypothetical protein
MAHLDGTKLAATALLTLGAAACSPEGMATSGAGGAMPAGAGGSRGMSTAVSTSVVTGSVGAGGTGGAAPVCDPPAAPGTFYAQAAEQYGSAGPTSMCDYRGDVLLVVNTADV